MYDLNITILDAGTVGDDIDFSIFDKFGKMEMYNKTNERQIQFRTMDSDIIIVNKLKLNSSNIGKAKHLKLICVTATGFDNIDLEFCRKNSIAVCNVTKYSTNSVAQLTASMALSLATNLSVFDKYVKDKSYTRSGVQNRVLPVFHELNGLTWGIVGLGAIGEKTAEIAKALGCNVVAYKRRRDPLYKCVELDTLCKMSDIISIHLPLTRFTEGIISREKISLMKKNAIVINVARGAVADEEALTKAVEEGRIGGLGIDVYSEEPMGEKSPYMRILDRDNVIFTPHMAWGAYEARVRCMEEIVLNIEAFLKGKKRNRVEI